MASEQVKWRFTEKSGEWLRRNLTEEQFNAVCDILSKKERGELKKEDLKNISDPVVRTVLRELKCGPKGYYVTAEEIQRIREAQRTGKVPVIVKKEGKVEKKKVLSEEMSILEYVVEFLRRFQEEQKKEGGESPYMCATHTTGLLGALDEIGEQGITIPTVSTWLLEKVLEREGWGNKTEIAETIKMAFDMIDEEKSVEKFQSVLNDLMKFGIINEKDAEKLMGMIKREEYDNARQLLKNNAYLFLASLPNGTVITLYNPSSIYLEEAKGGPTHTITKYNGEWYDYIGTTLNKRSNEDLAKWFRKGASFRVVNILVPPSQMELKMTEEVEVPKPGRLSYTGPFLAMGAKISREICGDEHRYKWYFAFQLYEAYKEGKERVAIPYSVSVPGVALSGRLSTSPNVNANVITNDIRRAYGDRYSNVEYQFLSYVIAREIASGGKREAGKRLAESLIEKPLEYYVRNSEGTFRAATLSEGPIQARPDHWIGWMRDDPQGFKGAIEFIYEFAEGAGRKYFTDYEREALKKLSNMSAEEMKNQKVLIADKGKMDIVNVNYTKYEYAYVLLHKLFSNPYFSGAMFVELSRYWSTKIAQAIGKTEVSAQDMGFIIMLAYHEGGLQRALNATAQYWLWKCAKSSGVEIPKGFRIDGRWGDVTNELYKRVIKTAQEKGIEIEDEYKIPPKIGDLKTTSFLVRVYNKYTGAKESLDIPHIAELDTSVVKPYYSEYIEANKKMLASNP